MDPIASAEITVSADPRVVSKGNKLFASVVHRALAKIANVSLLKFTKNKKNLVKNKNKKEIKTKKPFLRHNPNKLKRLEKENKPEKEKQE